MPYCHTPLSHLCKIPKKRYFGVIKTKKVVEKSTTYPISWLAGGRRNKRKISSTLQCTCQSLQRNISDERPS